MGLRETILQAADRGRVEVTAWGVTFWVRSLSARERDDFELANTHTRGKRKGTMKPNVRARLVCLCAVDADGQRIFSDGDAAELGKKSAAEVDRVFEVCRQVNHIGDGDWEEEEEKNSDAAPGCSSPSA